MRFSKKPRATDLAGRVREVLSDPNNSFIPRHPEAGAYLDGRIRMHNGLFVVDDFEGELSQVLKQNGGVHEPQEERVFGEVLKRLPSNATMIELGSYWAFYSMWFLQAVPRGRATMIEPVPERLEIGRKNFQINGLEGDFRIGIVGGENGISLEQLLNENGTRRLDILHSDIQGAEVRLLQDIRPLLESRRISYLFVSTHSQPTHLFCRYLLTRSGYLVIASADFDRETFCHDGVLVAQSPDLPIAFDQPLATRTGDVPLRRRFRARSKYWRLRLGLTR